jgi:hypothetical protein
MECENAAVMIRKRVSRARLPKRDAALDAPQMLVTARRGMRANADFMKLLRDQANAHRIAASISTLPRVRAHLSALAESLEAILGTEES